MRCTVPLLILLGSAAAFAQSLTVYSGNGQIVLEQFLTSVPMTVVARDAKGAPVPGLPITWSTTQGAGTIVRPAGQTNANGLAAADFLGTGVPFGYSFTQATVTATSALGSASFFVTTSIFALPGGGSGSLPLVELISPSAESLAVTGNVNAILPEAVKVRVSVASGPQAGHFLPNVGVVMHFYNDEEPQPAPFASCRGGTALTDSSGVATCDLMLNDRVGQVQLSAVAGEAQRARPFLLTIKPGAPCSYSIAPSAQSFGAAGGFGVISLTTGAGCNWSAASNSNWVILSGPVAGSSSAKIGFAVGTNAGSARNATITVGTQVFTVSQAAAGTTGSPLSISTTVPLPAGALSTPYSLAPQATGGTPPYQWLSNALPPGLSLNNGLIAGTPVSVGTYNFNLTVIDSTGNSVTQAFVLAVSTTPVTQTVPVITNAGFPVGAVGQPYKQAVTYLASCTSPFGPGPTIVLSSGALPPGLLLISPVEKSWVISGTPTTGGSYGFSLKITEICGRSTTSSFQLAISGAGGGGPGPGGAITALPPSLSFVVTAGSTSKPADLFVSLSSSNGVPLTYSASIVNATGGAWLSITSAATGTTPASPTLSVSNYQGLAPGFYSAQLALQSPGNSTVFLPVSLTVTSATPITASPSSLVFTSTMVQASTFLPQSLQISSIPSVHFTVGFSTDSQANWLAISPGSGETPTLLTVFANPVGLAPGTYGGRVTLTPVNGAATTIPVTLIVTSPPALLWSVPTVDNSYITSGPAPLPLTVNLASSGSALQFSLANTDARWLTVTPRFALTPANITLTFDPTGLAPGLYQAILTATPAGSAAQPGVPLAISFSVRQSAPTLSAILHGASSLPAPLAPGLQVQIVGTNLGPITQADSAPDPDTGLYPASLAGARVLFDNVPAAVLHASDRQVTVMVPYSVAGKSSVRVVAEYRFAQSLPQTVAVADSSPGIFTGAGSQGIILNEDGSYNSVNSGAFPGSVVSIIGTGEGQTDPGGVDGLLMVDGSLASPVLQVTAQIAGLNAEVVSATSAPGQPAGVFLIKVKVPDGAPSASVVPVSVSIGSAASQAGVTMAIAP